MTNFLTKVAQLVAILKKRNFLSRIYCGYFLGNFWKNLATLNFNILLTTSCGVHFFKDKLSIICIKCGTVYVVPNNVKRQQSKNV